MQTVLSFILPVRHPANARDWARVKANLAQTAASIAAQTIPAWNAVIVANRDADLPNLPAGFSVCRVDFPPNPLHEQGANNLETFRNAFRIDKGRRVLAGLLHSKLAPFVMICDDDDLVHIGLAAFVASHPSANGWYFGDGWVWEDGSRLLYRESRFHRICGTSHILRSDLCRIPDRIEAASEDYLCRMWGGHLAMDADFAARGHALQPLPFPGAIYRIGHPGAHSQSTGLQQRYFLSRNPLTIVRALCRLRWLTSRMQREYFHAASTVRREGSIDLSSEVATHGPMSS